MACDSSSGWLPEDSHRRNARIVPSLVGKGHEPECKFLLASRTFLRHLWKDITKEKKEHHSCKKRYMRGKGAENYDY